MREFLSLRAIPFVEHNIRRDPQAKADLMELTGNLAVPVVVAGDRHVVGYDPKFLEELVQAGADPATAQPPRDSADAEQADLAVRPEADPLDTIEDLVSRTLEELNYNAAKGGGAYREGMHDGLRFALDALVDILEQYDRKIEVPDTA